MPRPKGSKNKPKTNPALNSGPVQRASLRKEQGSTFEQAFKNIDDILRKEAGCTTELDYTEQTSWLLFLKYLDGLEQDLADESALEGKKYAYILDKQYRWESWVVPKNKDGKPDHNKAVNRLHSSFEDMVRKHEDTGTEYWCARDLQMLLGYTRWENFVKVIEKSITTCKSTGYEPTDHFRDVRKMVDVGSGAKREIEDIRTHFNGKQQAFLDFVLSHYVKVGVEELDQDKLTPLLRLKYHNSIADALADLGRAEEIGQVFAGFQKYLYQPRKVA